MGSCERCNKKIGYSQKYIRLKVRDVQSDCANEVIIKHFHKECFDKMFIYRNEDGSDVCICGKFATYRDSGLFVEIYAYNYRSEYSRYYHFDHFLKYWMGSICDGDLKC